ncbi:MAG: HAD family hydrolase [Bacteroidales bacterium]|nr:HAD family hydrolase [Bacteroidales bacterium]
MKCDSLIFDMDGTLWDAVDSYVTIWNRTLAEVGVNTVPVTRARLMKTMGLPLESILSELIPDLADKERFLEILDRNEHVMMPELGGRLYDRVHETLQALSARMPLFMVSNCGTYGLDNFLDSNDLRKYFKDALSHGQTGLSKADNIRLIVSRNALKKPFYVGDTESDSRAAHEAGTGMIWAAYGFGKVTDADYTIHSIGELCRLPCVAQL